MSIGNHEGSNLNRQDAKGAQKHKKLGVLGAFVVNFLLNRTTNALQG